jgi:hypothetical protein
MLGSCRIAEACRAESFRRRRSLSPLNGKGGVALTRFSQTCRDPFRDSGTFFSPKLIIFQRSPMIRHRVHEGMWPASQNFTNQNFSGDKPNSLGICSEDCLVLLSAVAAI